MLKATLTVALALFALPAEAALLTYAMIFTDSQGVVVGDGVVSWNTGLTKPIYGSGPYEEVCDPDAGGYCPLFADWHPLDIAVSFLGDNYTYNNGAGENYLEGTLVNFGKSAPYSIVPGNWTNYDTYGDWSWFIDPLSGTFDLQGAFVPNYEIYGTVSFERIYQTPLPAALFLFPVGIAGWRIVRKFRR